MSWKSLALLIVAFALWPWLSGVTLAPMAADSHLWIARGATFDAGWAEWVFATKHFRVGYKPVTALSYTLNELVGGLRPWVYRATDLAIFAAAALGVAALARALLGGAGDAKERSTRRAAWPALLALVLFAAHPACEEVVPFISRRGYALATALGSWGVFVAVPRAGAAVSCSRSSGAGLLLAAALLAYEPAIVTVALLPFCVWAALGARPDRTSATLRACAGTVLFVGLALAARFFVVGGIGGYDGHGGERGERALAIFLAAWRGLFGVSGTAGSALALSAAAYTLWRSLTGARRALRLVPWLWLATYPVLYATQGVWFPRQAFFMVPPFALLVAAIAADILERYRAHPTRLALHAAPLFALVALVAAQSPLVHGPDTERMQLWRRRDAQIRAMIADLGTLHSASVVLLQPYWRPPEREESLRPSAADTTLERLARAPSKWVEMVLREQELVLLPYIYFDERGLEHARPTAHVEGGELVVRVPAGLDYLVRRGAAFEWVAPAEPAVERLPRVPGVEPEHAYLVTRGAGELFDLRAGD